ncbi:CDP-diacylglycerol--glycerol-3-phosphate 3-phosphatidyltransferase [Oceanivirga salmonicida]|uniref:CDP-diacylglycerol--glycerol-3-phosphate 3-phosphatidyltransferase n=1 Tax=Oceanivirga salmonicida TaxID=1769291 RepID=UPI000834E4C6|nr:CDP-diacylglycerol--glycerol-3-phosphate 3-phosphatidyltransferase [Oceanivirga salmonicida]
MDLNKANKLTILRLILIIPFLIFLSLSYYNTFFVETTTILILKGFARLIALTIFALAVATDYYDGKIARETNTVTDFGKLMDPIADKLLTFTFLLVLLKAGAVSLLLVLILLFREFLVTAERALVSIKGGMIIPASDYGKYKTVTLYAALFMIGLLNLFIQLSILNSILLLPTVILSVISAVEYHNNAKKYIEF